MRSTRPQDNPMRVGPILQDCFDHVDWDMFRAASDDNIEAYSDTVTCFIRKCIEDVVMTKTIRIYPNQKPWINSDVRAALSAQTSAFKSGNPETLTIKNKPLTISGNQSKPPNDNIKTKLKNNSPLYRMSLIIFMLVLRLTTPPIRDAPIWKFWPIPIILYIWKPITDMLADKSLSKFLYTFWEPD